MSHMTTAAFQPRNRAILLRSAQECKFPVIVHGLARFYGGQSERCDLVIQVPDSEYDIGVNYCSDGSAVVRVDRYGRTVDAGLMQLQDRYIHNLAAETAAATGMVVSSETVQNDMLTVVIEGE